MTDRDVTRRAPRRTAGTKKAGEQRALIAAVSLLGVSLGVSSALAETKLNTGPSKTMGWDVMPQSNQSKESRQLKQTPTGLKLDSSQLKQRKPANALPAVQKGN